MGALWEKGAISGRYYHSKRSFSNSMDGLTPWPPLPKFGRGGGRKEAQGGGEGLRGAIEALQ
jgi:hypothetical protein